MFSTEIVLNGVVVFLSIEKWPENNTHGNPPGLDNMRKRGMHDKTVEYAMVMRFMINASVTVEAFKAIVL